jgi:hypothetical protein
MPTKKTACFLVTLLLFSGLMCTANASSNTTVTLHGAGVTVDLTFPEEAHPDESITHNITITANTLLTMNFTIVIYAPVNSSWQEVRSQTLTDFELQENNNFTSRLGFTLPQQTNGTLYCFLNVSTSVNENHLSATLYTTRVSELTFSEMQVLYDEMLANYTSLQEDYATLLGEYDDLLVNYSSLFDNYTALLSDYDALSAQYNGQVSNYQNLLNDYNQLSADYDSLNADYSSTLGELSTARSDYDTLNSTHYSMLADYEALQAVYNALNQTYTELQDELADLQARFNFSENTVNSDRIVMFVFIVAVAVLVAFIIYIRWKKQEPYVVIRKETVSVNPDENSESSG